MSWSLDQAYDAYPRIEEEFSEALDASLAPRGPGLLFDLVAGLGLAPGATAIDVGCGEGRHAVELARRFGLSVIGIDPVPRHIEIARGIAGAQGPAFELGSAERIPVADARLAWSGAAMCWSMSATWPARSPSSAACLRQVGGSWSTRCSARTGSSRARPPGSGTRWAW